MTTYKYRNKLYTILSCTLDDIPSHIERVYLYWNSNEVEVQRQRMVDAIKNGCAYKLVCDNQVHTFAYYEHVDVQSVNGIAMWWSTIRLFFMFGHWFRHYNKINITYIYPHKEDIIVFKSIIEDYNISWYSRDTSRPLIIDLWSPKCEHIKELMGKLEMVEV